MKREPSPVIGALLRHRLQPRDICFSADQKRALAHRGSPLVLWGGPGVGKSTVIVEAALARINAGQDPNSILLISYGRERVSELRDAVALHTSAIMSEPIARTFHSLAFSILKMKAASSDPEPILMSGAEQEYFIRELLLGDIAAEKNYWPADLHAALPTHGFARELRDLILRASERGLLPADLEKLSHEYGEKYWPAAAKFWDQYLGVMDLLSDSAGDAKRRIDPSQIVAEALRHLRAHPAIAQELRARFPTILVDEFQESDPAQRQLLRELAGSDLLICADGDSAVGRFRGADPDQLKNELDFYLAQGESITLNVVFRSPPQITDLGSAIAGEFRGSASQRVRSSALEPANAEVNDELKSAPILIARFRSQSEEAQFIAYQLRFAHLIEKRPWRQMAVILRSAGGVSAALRRAFIQAGIPISLASEALAGNPAISPFLLVAQIAVGERKLTIENCEKLLLSELGGADAVSLRRIRRALIAQRGEEDLRSGSELLISAIRSGEFIVEGGEPLYRIHNLLARVEKIARKPSTQGEDLLWEIWDNAISSSGSSSGEKISESWRRQALRGGVRGAVADRDLDAMMELFEAARRFGERFPNSGAGRFIAQITEENILGDVITAKGQRPDVVEILTVHSAKGRQWEIVAIAGLQEGQWPNLRQRGSLLGSERLVERMRHGALPRKELDLLTANGLAEDERRLLHVAVTRAKSQLIVSAVEKDEEEPSIFFEEIYHHLHPELDEEVRITAPARPITPAALVATLRSELQGSQSAKAAAILQRLKVEGLAQADPEQWSGSLPVSSTAPVIPVGALVPISPSSAENFTDCGVKWFLEKSGGGNGDTSAQILGSAIHAFAALVGKDPNLSEADLVGRLTSAWKLIDPHTGWVSAGELRRAVRMLQQFMEYHTTTPRELLGVEIAFSITLGRAVIKGSVDRLEVSADGELFIVDFKTSATPISLAKALENKQMQAYQLAVAEGGFTDIHPSTDSSGAALVYLGATSKKVTQRLQPVIDSASVKEDIVAIGEAMSGNSFIATINSRCKQCLVKNSCPIQSDGRTVME